MYVYTNQYVTYQLGEGTNAKRFRIVAAGHLVRSAVSDVLGSGRLPQDWHDADKLREAAWGERTNMGGYGVEADPSRGTSPRGRVCTGT